MKSVFRAALAGGFCVMILAHSLLADASCDQWQWMNPSPQGNTLSAMVYGDDLYVAVGHSGAISTSFDGESWVTRETGTLEDLNDVIWHDGSYVAVGNRGLILASTDGVTWTSIENDTIRDLLAIVWDGAQFFVVSESWVVLTSPDGEIWTVSEVPPMHPVALAWGNGLFVGIEDDEIISSKDGFDWSVAADSNGDELHDVIWTGTEFVVVGSAGIIWMSEDGETWVERDSHTSRELFAVLFAEDRYVVVGRTGIVLSSGDGTVWERWEAPLNLNLLALSWGEQGFVAVGQFGAVATSPLAREWTARSVYEPRTDLVDVAWSGSKWLTISGIVPDKATISDFYWSNTGEQWNKVDVPFGEVFNALACSVYNCVAVGDGRIVVSEDLETWQSALEDPVVILSDVHWGGDRYIAVGYHRDTSAAIIRASFNGVQWFDQSPAGASRLAAIARSDMTWVSVGVDGLTYWSRDGQNWTEVWANTPKTLLSVTWTGERFVAVGERSLIVTSENGREWVLRAAPSGGVVKLHDVAALGSKVVAIGIEGTVFQSPEGIEWHLDQVGSVLSLNALAFNGEAALIVGEDGTIFGSICYPRVRRPAGRIR